MQRMAGSVQWEVLAAGGHDHWAANAIGTGAERGGGLSGD